MGAGGNLDNYAMNAAVNCSFHIILHTTRETEYLGAEVAFYDLFDSSLVRGRYCRHARFDAVYPRFGQLLGDP